MEPHFVMTHQSVQNLNVTYARLQQYLGVNIICNQVRQPTPYFSLYFPKTKPSIEEIRALMDSQIQLLEGPFGLSPDVMQVLQIRDAQIERANTKSVPKRQFPTFPVHDTVIVLDYEAFLTNPLAISEIGVARVQGGKLVATLQCFFRPSEEIMQQLQKNGKSISLIERMTRIPAPWKPSFNTIREKVEDAQMADFIKFFELFVGSDSTKINQSLIASGLQVNLTILAEFPQSTPIIVAKGCQMEQKVLNSWGLKQEVFECQELYFSEKKVELSLDSIHNGRPFEYCPFHIVKIAQVAQSNTERRAKMTVEEVEAEDAKKKKDQEEAHCALDDVLFVARQFIK